MSCGCSENEEKKDVGPVREVRTTEVGHIPVNSGIIQPEVREPPEEKLPKRLIKFM